jgi:ribonuclease D
MRLRVRIPASWANPALGHGLCLGTSSRSVSIHARSRHGRPSRTSGSHLRPTGIIARMSLPSLPSPVLIQGLPELERLAANLAGQRRIAVDTESNSLYAYRERVCLIQFSAKNSDYLVDPLAISDMSCLAPIFADAKIEKVFHAAEYDVLCLKRDYGFKLSNLFDTRIASRTLGRKRSGLGDILAEEFQVEINKRFQRANWGKRPLSTELLDYARLDTHFLLPLRERLAKELRTAGRWEEALEACEAVKLVEPEPATFDPQGFWRIAHARQLKPEQAAVLRQLYLLRDKHAQRLDRPAFKVLGDRTLLAIAQELPKSLAGLGKLPGMTSGQVHRYGKEVLEAIQRGRTGPRPKPPSNTRVEEVVMSRYQTLREWRMRVAKTRQVESDIVLPRDLVWDIAHGAPRDRKALKELMGPYEWRFRMYADDILHLLWT